MITTSFRWELIAEKSLNFCCVESVGGVIEYANPAVQKILGYSPESLIGLHLSDLVHPEDKETYLESVQTSIASQEQVFNHFRIKHADNSWRYIECNRCSFQENGGGFIAIMRDISRNRALEEADSLRQSHIKRQNEALIELNRLAQLQDCSLEEAIHEIVTVSADLAQVTRLSIWQISNDYLKCISLYKAHAKTHLNGFRLKTAQFQEFLEVLQEKTVILIQPDQIDPSSEKFYKTYLSEVHINSAICIALCREGEMQGMLIFESKADRQWSPEEIAFARSIASTISYAFGSEHTNQLQSDLMVSEAKFRNLYELAPLMAMTIDEEGRILTVNHQWVEESGYSKQASEGDYLHSFMPFFYAERFLSESLPALKQGSRLEKEVLQLEQADGSIIDVFVDGVTVQEGPIYLLILRDITQHLKTERSIINYNETLEREVRVRTEQITLSEAKFRKVVEACPLGIALVNLDQLTIEEVNQAYADMLEYSQAELKGVEVRQITHPEDRHEDKKLLEKFKRGEIDNIEFEKRYITQTGKTIWARVKTALIMAEDGHTVYSVGIIEDITEKKVQRQRLKLLEAVTKFSQAAICIVDVGKDNSQKQVIYVNPTFVELTGYSEEEAFDPDYQVCATTIRLVNDSFKTRRSYQVEGMISTKGGSQYWGELTVSPLFETTFAVIISDISDRKQMEENLRAALMSERKSNEMKSRFVSMVSHEIRNPISVIRTAHALLSQYMDALSTEKRMAYLKMIDDSTQAMVELTDNVIELARTSEVSFKPVEINSAEL